MKKYFCKHCKNEKVISEFYRQSLSKCKECIIACVKEYREKNLEKIREYDRKRGYTEKRLALNREHSRKVRKENRGYNLAWMERNPDKRAAYVIFRNALRSGRIKKGVCEMCGKKKVEGHHEDYAKPLEVRWLCRKHHAEIHRKYKDEI